jgi:hypothetical protein
MATGSSRGNKELPNVEHIGKGPSECQLGLQEGGVKGGVLRGGGGAASLTNNPSIGCAVWGRTCRACDVTRLFSRCQ